jgi:hypothetical protein
MNVEIYINPSFFDKYKDFGKDIGDIRTTKKSGMLGKARRTRGRNENKLRLRYKNWLDSLTTSIAKQTPWNKVAVEIASNLEKLDSDYFPENLRKTNPALAAQIDYSLLNNLEGHEVNKHRENERIMKESVCRGVIDNAYLDESQINENALIFVVRDSNSSIQAFAVCRFKRYKNVGEWNDDENKYISEEQHYLYIDVICSKSRLATPMLWASIEDFVKANHKKNKSTPRSQRENVENPYQPPKPIYLLGIQLSSLTYVIGYYYLKKKFKFYKIDTLEKLDIEHKSCNNMAEKFANLKGERGIFDGRFTRADDRNYKFLYETQKFEDIPEYNIIGTDEQKQLENGEEDDEKGLWYYDWAQKERVKVKNKTNTQLNPGTAELLINFISNEKDGGMCGQHSVQFGIKNTRLQTGANTWRDREKKILSKEWLEEKDPGSEGWTMFWKPETYDYDSNISRDKIGSIFHAQRRGGKRTKKRALKKRHRKKTKRRVKRKNKRTRRKRKKTKKRY